MIPFVKLLCSPAPQVARLARYLGVTIPCVCEAGCAKCHADLAFAIQREAWLQDHGDDGIPGSHRREAAE